MVLVVPVFYPVASFLVVKYVHSSFDVSISLASRDLYTCDDVGCEGSRIKGGCSVGLSCCSGVFAVVLVFLVVVVVAVVVVVGDGVVAAVLQRGRGEYG